MAVTAQIRDLVEVQRYTRGLIGPSTEPDQLLRPGGRIKTVSPPGCWGPMITPTFVGGHEVSWPVAVDGAEIGDAIAITIERVDVRSFATSSGTMITKEAAFGSDPFVDRHCPGCGTPWPETRVEGTGEAAIRCVKCGAECSPFAFEEGYTIVFDDDRIVGVTVDARVAHEFALRAREVAALPEGSEQHPILIYEPHTIPGTIARLRSFIGNVGTIPSRDMPDSHNAGDFGSFLIGAGHRYAMTEQELVEHRTDGHLDCDAVRQGAVLVVPVKVSGGGVYVGDSHANQGDGELSLHTTDITADVQLKVDLLKGVELAGPVLLPVAEDLPWIARPFSAAERERGRKLAERYEIRPAGPVGPIQFIGTGSTINAATDNAIERAAKLLGFSQAQVRNRCTIGGSVEIARLPGAVQLTMLAPLEALDRVGLGALVREQYSLAP